VVCEHLAPFLEIWPISGMTRGGSVFALPMSARRMDGSESSSLPTPRATRGGSSTETTALLPTPDASNFNDGQTVEAWAERKERELAKGYNGNGGGTPLAMMVQLLPTPEAKLSDSGPDYARADRDGSGGDDLTTTIHRMLPTPTARLGDGTSRGASHPDRRKELDPKRGGELDEVAVHLLPTPTTEPSTGNGHAKNLGKEAALLPTPTANQSPTRTPEGARVRIEQGHQEDLETAVALLPTPTSRDWKDGACAETDVPTNALLGRAATRLLPTPSAADGAGPGRHNAEGHQTTLPGTVRLLPTPRASDGPGPTAHNRTWSKTDRSLHTLVHDGTLLPTPTAADAIGSRNSTHPRPPGSKAHIGDTLTDAATVLTGARTRANSGDRTSQPSDDGSGSPGEQLHLQPSQDETDNLD
jgi:hypothetical protein